MKLNVIKQGLICIVEIDFDCVDAANSVRFKTELLALLNPDCDTVLDLKAVSFIDSSGIGVLLSCMRRLRAGGGTLLLCNLQPVVQSIMKLVHLDRVIGIFPSRNKAVHALQSGE